MTTYYTEVNDHGYELHNIPFEDIEICMQAISASGDIRDLDRVYISAIAGSVLVFGTDGHRLLYVNRARPSEDAETYPTANFCFTVTAEEWKVFKAGAKKLIKQAPYINILQSTGSDTLLECAGYRVPGGHVSESRLPSQARDIIRRNVAAAEMRIGDIVGLEDIAQVNPCLLTALQEGHRKACTAMGKRGHDMPVLVFPSYTERAKDKKIPSTTWIVMAETAETCQHVLVVMPTSWKTNVKRLRGLLNGNTIATSGIS